jgi:hypothetical protein
MTLVHILSQVLAGTTTVVDLVQSLFVMNMVSGTLTLAIGRIYLRQPVGVFIAYRWGFRRYGALLVASVIQGLLIGIPVGVLFLFSVEIMIWNGFGRNTPLLRDLLLLVIILPPGLFLLTRFFLIPQVVVLEGRGPVDSVRRSWSLSQGAFWRMARSVIAILILSYLIAELPTTAVRYVLRFDGSGTDFGVDQVVFIVAQCGRMLVWPIQCIVATLLYYDLRLRKEGYDIELLLRQTTNTKIES